MPYLPRGCGSTWLHTIYQIFLEMTASLSNILILAELFLEGLGAISVLRAFGLALHRVRHSKTPGIFGMWIEVALQ